MSRFSFWHGGGRPTVEFLGYLVRNNGGGSSSSVTFSGVNFGAPQADREIVLTISHGSPGSQTVSSANVGGVSAALGAGAGGASIGASVRCAYVQAPVGTSGNVSLTFSGNVPYVVVGVFRITGRTHAGAAPVDFSSTFSGSGSSTSVLSGIDVPENGFAVSCLAIGSASAPPTVSGAPFSLDAVGNVQSGGSPVYHGIAHCPVQEAAIANATLTWGIGASRPHVSAAWVFGE